MMAVKEKRKNGASLKESRVRYWLETAADDWKAARQLYQNGSFIHALFFGHLALEKTIKAVYAKKFNENPPYTHRLVYLAEKASIKLSSKNRDLLEIVTDFNLEARYPDEKFSFRRRCTKNFTRKYMKEIREARKWLLQILERKR